MKKKILLIGCLPLSILAAVVAYFVGHVLIQPHQQHELRKQEATAAMLSFNATQWKALYAECMDLLDRQPDSMIAKEQWPPTIRQINPYHVGTREDEVWMNWTGGFDDDSIYLFARKHTVVETDTRPGFPAGITIDDSREILPHEPYTVNQQ